MPLNLTELIKAAGNAGTAGQSFKSQVTGAAEGFGMLAYRVTGLDINGTLPVDSTELPGAYASGTTFAAVNLDLTGYGSKADQIRRPGVTGWSFELTGGTTGRSYTINSLTEATPSTFDMSITFYGSYSGSFSINAAENFSIPTEWGDPWTWTFTAQQGGTSGSDTLFFTISYDHDTANFNPVLSSNAYEFDMNRRAYPASAVRYRWFDNDTDATNNTNPVLEGNGSGYSTIQGTSYGNSHPSNVNTSVWLRWTADLTGSSGWSAKIGPASITGETRNQA